MRMVRMVPVGVAAVLLTGCGTASPSNMSFASAPPADRTPYMGLLSTAVATETPTKTVQRPGAAGDVVECSIPPTGATLRPGSRQRPADSPETAVDDSVSTELPVRQLALERVDSNRVLFTTSYDGIARQAVIVRKADPASDPAATDTDGWYTESYAYCDLADYPESVTAAAGIEIWTDADGVRQPTTIIESSRGPEHCDLQDVRFLSIGRRTNAYVDKLPPDMEDDFAEQPRSHVTVPSNAEDTGFARNGDHLWLSPDRTRAYVGSAHDAALWPQEVRSFGCA